MGEKKTFQWEEKCGLVHMALNTQLRSGGPKLKETQSYPARFCRAIAGYHKKWCIDTCQTIGPLPIIGHVVSSVLYFDQLICHCTSIRLYIRIANESGLEEPSRSTRLVSKKGDASYRSYLVESIHIYIYVVLIP